MSSLQHDLTRGPILRQLILFSLPLLCANVLQLLYGMADMLVVSRFVGGSGLAAVSNAGRLAFLISSLCMGFSVGGTVVAARYFARGDIPSQRETVGTLFCLALILAALVTILSLAVYKPVLRMMDVPAEAMTDAAEYTRITCAGTVFVFGYNTVCAVLRGFGNSRSPLVFVATAAAINIVLDLILVGPFGMGVRGAAVATIVAQGVSFAAAARHLRKHGFVFDFKPRHFAIKPDKLRMILRVGVPSSAQMAVVNLSFLIITGMLNPYGVDVAAASGIGLKINTLAGMPCWAVGQAMTAMAAQNFGAGDMARVRQVALTGLRVNMAVTIAIVAVIQLFAEPFVMLFAPANAEITAIGVRYLRVCCTANCVLYVTMYCFDSFALGVGRADIALFNSLLDAVVAKLALSWFAAVVLNMGYTGIYAGQALSSLIPAIAGTIFYCRGTWANAPEPRGGTRKSSRSVHKKSEM